MKNLNVILNGQKAGKSLIRTMINGLNDPRIRTEKGGYLFKIALKENSLLLGILPEFNQGERNYHYYIELPGSPEYVLTGSLNPEGVFSILFIPRERELSNEAIEMYRNLYLKASAALLEMGLERPGVLDMVTRMLLQSSGLFTEAPESLAELAELS